MSLSLEKAGIFDPIFLAAGITQGKIGKRSPGIRLCAIRFRSERRAHGGIAMAAWIVISGIGGFVIYALDSLIDSFTELNVGRGWLRLEFARDNKRLVKTRHAKRPARRKQVKN
jgi:hypothetical protein